MACCPDLNTNAANLERGFLNYLSMKCARSMGVGVDPPMRWTAKYSTNILPGHKANRKPNLTLFTYDTNDDWRCVRSIGEMTSRRSHTGFAELLEQVRVSGEMSLIVNSKCLDSHYVCSQISHHLWITERSKLCHRTRFCKI
jgi:hypothetical protein